MDMPNKTLKILFLYNGMFVLAGSLLGPLYAIFVEKLNAGVMPVSYSWAAFLLSTTIFTFALSKTGDGYKHKRYLLAGGYLVRSLCWMSLIFITNIWQLVLVQFVLGIGEALGTPAFDAIFAEHLDKNRHMMDYSDWKVIANGVLVAGTLLGGFIVTKMGFIPLFIFMSVLSFVSFVGLVTNKCIDARRVES